MNVNGHDKLLNLTLGHKLKYRNRAFIADQRFGIWCDIYRTFHVLLSMPSKQGMTL